MKQFLLIVGLFLGLSPVYSQINQAGYVIAGQDVGKFLSKNIRYPAAYLSDTNPSVIVVCAKFQLDENGHIFNIKTNQLPPIAFQDEVKRVLELSDKQWDVSGLNVNLYFALPVIFVFNDRTNQVDQKITVAQVQSSYLSIFNFLGSEENAAKINLLPPLEITAYKSIE